MVEYYKLDKVLSEGTNYEMPADMFYLVKKIGTDSTAGAKLKIDGVDTGAIVAGVAPMHKTSSNKLGPLDLGDLYYVIPPNKKFSVEGGGSDKMRIAGQIAVLAPGEVLPAEYASRYTAQGKHYLTYIEESKDYAADTTWNDGTEIEIGTLTPKTIEEYRLNHYAGAESGVASPADGAVGVIFKLDGKPLDVLTSDPGKLGIDVNSMPRPPAGTTESEPFSFESAPVIVKGDHTLTVTMKNNSGGALTIAAATDQYVTAVVEYLMSK